MRRTDREIINFDIIKEIINTNNLAVISMCNGDVPYGTMLHYAPVFNEDNKVKLIFHCAGNGRKNDFLHNNPEVSIFICDNANTRIVSGGHIGIKWTTHYRSVVVAGAVRWLENRDEKRVAAHAFMGHFSEETMEITDAHLDMTAFFEVEARSISGKQNPGPQRLQ